MTECFMAGMTVGIFITFVLVFLPLLLFNAIDLL